MATPILDRPDERATADPTAVGDPDGSAGGRHRAPGRRATVRTRRAERKRLRRTLKAERSARRRDARRRRGRREAVGAPTNGERTVRGQAHRGSGHRESGLRERTGRERVRGAEVRPGRTSQAVAIAIVLIGLAVAVGWLGVAPLVLGDDPTGLDGPLAPIAQPEAGVSPLLDGVKVVGNLQISQPRDPFRPLVSEDGTALTPAPGSGSGGEGGFEPSGITVRLLDIRDVGGVLRATVEVDGVTYEVGVGDTFAGSFQVVSLDGDSGVFLFGDNAFELQVGQEILK